MFKNRAYVKHVLKSVFARYVRGKADVEDRDLVDSFYDNISDEEINKQDADRIGAEIKQQIDRQIQQPRKIGFRIYIPAAACLIVLLTVLVTYRNKSHNDTAGQKEFAQSTGPIVKIGEERFTDLKQKIPTGSYFETEDDGKVLNLKNVSGSHKNDPIIIDNTSENMFSVALSDGSKVRLSPRASIRLGGNFDRGDRLVRAEGEVHFKVAQQSHQGVHLPFVVQTNMQTIEVLGTQFLVDASAEAEENVHLQEGRVKLTHNGSNQEVFLRPGQQAFLNIDQPQIYILQTGNEDKVNAWRNGLFLFERETLGDVMQELSEWYGIKINVNHNVARLSIVGTFSRYDDVREVLEMIELTNKIRFYEKKGVLYVTKR